MDRDLLLRLALIACIGAVVYGGWWLLAPADACGRHHSTWYCVLRPER